jgi:hypothetical protein
MALTNANVTPSNVQTDSTGQKEYIFGQLTFSGTYPAAGGELFDISQFFQDKSAPKVAFAMSLAGANGYSYGFVPGATLATGKIKISTASNTELTNAAYPAGVTGDTVYFCAYVKKA